MPISMEEISRKARLMSLPDLYVRLRTILSDPDYSMVQIAELIGNDPGMSARILKIVNSAFFGFPARIETVSRAINMLGTQQIHDLVLATSVTKTFEGISTEVMDMHTFWYNSVYCAVSARLLASACNVLDSERLFVAGLLRDIGHLLMYQHEPGLSEQCMQLAEESGRPLFRVERELFGYDYAQVGAHLMRQWQLPRSLVEATEFHVEPDRAQEHGLECGIIHIACQLTQAMTKVVDVEQQVLHADPLSWSLTGLSPNQCPSIHLDAESQMGEVMALIFPPQQRRSA